MVSLIQIYKWSVKCRISWIDYTLFHWYSVRLKLHTLSAWVTYSVRAVGYFILLVHTFECFKMWNQLSQSIANKIHASFNSIFITYSLIKTHFHRMYDFLLLHWGIVCEKGTTSILLRQYFALIFLDEKKKKLNT